MFHSPKDEKMELIEALHEFVSLQPHRVLSTTVMEFIKKNNTLKSILSNIGGKFKKLILNYPTYLVWEDVGGVPYISVPNTQHRRRQKDKQLSLRQLPDVVDLKPTNNDLPVQMAGGGSKAEIVPRKKEPLGNVEIQIQTSTRSLEADLTYMNMLSVEGDMAVKDTKCESSESRYIIG